jgi:hypothetical protein
MQTKSATKNANDKKCKWNRNAVHVCPARLLRIFTSAADYNAAPYLLLTGPR